MQSNEKSPMQTTESGDGTDVATGTPATAAASAHADNTGGATGHAGAARWSGARGRLRLTGLVLLGALLLALVAVACGGDDDDDGDGGENASVTADGEGTPGRGGPEVIMSTFTPVPPDFTPEVMQTAAAQQTAYAQTATAQPATTATPPPAVSPPSGPVATVPGNQIQPPDVFLQTPGGRVAGSKGSYNWYEIDLDTGAEVRAPYIVLDQGSMLWASGTGGELDVPDADFPVGSVRIEFFDYETNVAIPQNPDGTVMGDDLAFFQQNPAVRSLDAPGPTVSFQPEVPSGTYIILATVNWQNDLGLPLQSTYAFAVQVQ